MLQKGWSQNLTASGNVSNATLILKESCVKQTECDNLLILAKHYKDNIFNALPHFTLLNVNNLIFVNKTKKNMLILNVMPATHFKQVRTGETKDWDSCKMLRK